MRCNKVQIWLQGYVDGELSPRQMKRVRRHLDRCPDCAGELNRLSELKTLVMENRVKPEMDATPEFFWSQVQARIQGEAEPRRAWRTTFDFSWPRVLAWASSGVAALVVAGFVWVQSLPQPAKQAFNPSPHSNGTPVAAQIEKIETSGPEVYAEAYHSKQSQATIIWTEGMPVISLEL